MNKKIIIGIVLIFGIGLIAFNILKPSQIPIEIELEKESEQRLEVLNLSFEDYNGNIVSIRDFEGMPMVINTWATWCPFCRKELPDFAVAQREFGDRVIIIAIDRKESLKQAKKYSDELGVSDDLIFLLDNNDDFYRMIGGFTMPETIFINAAGEIIDHKRGPMELPEIRERIERIL